jgi:hypothetical protein
VGEVAHFTKRLDIGPPQAGRHARASRSEFESNRQPTGADVSQRSFSEREVSTVFAGPDRPGAAGPGHEFRRGAGGCCRTGIAAGVRQSRWHAAGARFGPAPRSRHSPGARRRPRATLAATDDGEPGAGSDGRPARILFRCCRLGISRFLAPELRYTFRYRASSECNGARVYRRHRTSHDDTFRTGSGITSDSHRPDSQPQERTGFRPIAPVKSRYR